ncbi:CGNR zinc finger domain-containing protein [Streptomyces fuscigenes]|uniref:CGNR zinc finger domain-containing protein n=1 Tax=Streptomyces fuscigenes TaxID=1528880 RepID=UPI001F20136B|nr:ABATE domain-containing protein [Streptomyces fuscigenes]MCF3960191.1 ABATE domain-containing protein [Streptomyces fuscigenes]
MTVSPSLDDMQRAGFPMGGEPSIAVDFADTLVTTTEPWTDLLADPAAATRWWQTQAARLPAGPPPDPLTARRLRNAVRDLLDSHLEGRAAHATSVEDVNAIAATVPTSVRIATDAAAPRAETRWHVEAGGNAPMAAVAREAVSLITDPERMGRLRRCANPECSMLFLAETKRRMWCTANLCGNRARAARHYQRTRSGTTDA